MLTVRTFACAAVVGVSVWVVACGDAALPGPTTLGSSFDTPLDDGTDDDDDNKANGFGDKGFGDQIDKPRGDASIDANAPTCASASVEAKRKPVKLVMALDQSGSMGLQGFGDPALKWNPVTQAFTSFLSDPKSKGIEGSLRLFPKLGGTNDAEKAVNCAASTYATADVPMTALPNAAPFTAKLPKIPSGMQTPTRSILKATVADAIKVKQQFPNDAVAIVFMSDGDPIGCFGTDGADENMTNVAGEAKVAADAGIPVYVIGVGTVPNLDLIAKQGGTTSAFIVPVMNPTETKQKFLAAVDHIRLTQASCTLNISTPSGRIDPKQASLTFTPGTGAPVTKPYDPDCTQGGFDFDNVAAPTKVKLCSALCDSLKSDPDAKISLTIPCAPDSPK